MEILNTIEKYSKAFDTNQEPLLMMCNNFEEYIVKHQRGSRSKIFVEFAVSKILEYFEVNTPEVAIINVRKDHVKKDGIPAIPYHWVNKLVFGSKFEDRASKLYNEQINIKNNYSFLEQFFKIALLDIVLVNNDRHGNNSNLLYFTNDKEISLLAIDHENCFDGLTFERIEITKDDSILSNYNYSLRKLKIDVVIEIKKKVLTNFQQKSINCKIKLKPILEKYAEILETDKLLVPKILYFLDEEWLNSCTKYFSELIEFYRQK
jgi:hypothetical protein